MCVCVFLLYKLAASSVDTSVWERKSFQATVVSMVTGGVDVREEVGRTGCSEAARRW